MFMDKNQPLLEIRGLSVIYPSKRGNVQAIDNLYLNVPSGSRLGLVGESGCGKSTVLLSILQLINRPGRITCGEIVFKGRDLLGLSRSKLRSTRGKEITMIFQDPQTTLNPSFHVGEQIRESLRLHHIVPGPGLPWPFDIARNKLEKERVLQAMSEVGIPSPMDRYAAYPHQFSGGMQQRALIALALVCGPSLLLADEPTTALDVTIQAQILDLMLKINQDHHTAIVLVTHDLGVAAEFCDTISVMYAGRIVEQGQVDNVVLNPQHPYTQGLLSCRPSIGQKGQRIKPIPGNVPDVINLPPGCAFAPRCPLARPICGEGPIPMFQTADGSFSRCLTLVNFEREANWSWEHIIRMCNE
jgi:oligopeptide/dipeptide ABC transporter ATP-binding protein